MPLRDSDWMSLSGRTVEPVIPARALYERLKLVAKMVTNAPQGGATGPRLLWRNGSGEVAMLALAGEVLIGRGQGCDVRVDNSRVSREHCRVTLLRGVAWLADLGSTNGTFLNGQRVSVPSVLLEGDVIALEGLVIVFLA